MTSHEHYQGPPAAPLPPPTLAERAATVVRLELNPQGSVTMEPGQPMVFTAVPVDFEGQAVQGLAAEWESSDPAVVSVETSGEAVAVAPGAATLTARAGDKVAAVRVVVTPATGEKLHVIGNVRVTGDFTADGNISAKYRDVAEWVPSRQKLSAGTVVVLDTTASNHVVSSSTAYDTGVAGVVSEQPGIILGEGGEGKVMVATTGRVRVRVDATRAPVRIGDLLVTGDTPGVAMKSEPVVVGGRKLHAPGTIVGKALEPLAGGVGEILVLLSLQ